MQTLGVVEDTLFVPMLGRIYASEHYPQILYDKKALELKKKLPSDLICEKRTADITNVNIKIIPAPAALQNTTKYTLPYISHRTTLFLIQKLHIYL